MNETTAPNPADMKKSAPTCTPDDLRSIRQRGGSEAPQDASGRPTTGQAARQQIEELRAQFASSGEYMPDFDRLKVEINNLLFMFLPGDTPLRELESFSCAIFAMVMDEWEKRQA